MDFLINKKWSLQILFFLKNKQNISYRNIKNKLQIPNSTLSIRLTELTNHKYIEKSVYGSVSKPHYTDYKITNIGLECINSLNYDKL